MYAPSGKLPEGQAVNFNPGIIDILSRQLVQAAKNRPDKVYDVNVISNGDPLEIYTNAGGEVIFKKYSPIGELSSFATEYAEALVQGTKLPVIICDRDHCVAAAGISKKEVLERRVTPSLENIMEERRSVSFDTGNAPQALEGFGKNILVGVPIINAGDVSGAVVLVEDENTATATESDIKLVSVAAAFLGRQVE